MDENNMSLAPLAATATAEDKTAFMLGADETDILTGGMKNDLLVGAAGSDVLQGEAGDDTLTGGDGTQAILTKQTTPGDFDAAPFGIRHDAMAGQWKKVSPGGTAANDGEWRMTA